MQHWLMLRRADAERARLTAVVTVCGGQLVALNDSQDAIKPNIKSERNTIILREIPSATAPADVEAIFAGCGTVESVRSDVGDTWFVTMASEDEAVSTLLALRSKTFNGAVIKARLKSENTLKSFYPTQPAESAGVAPGASYGGRGYYGAAPVGYYDVPNHYGVQYQATAAPRAPYSNGGADSRYTQPRSSGGRGSAAAGGSQGRQQGGRGGNAQQQLQPAKDGAAKGTPSSKKSKKAAAAKQQAPGANSNGAKKAATAAAPAAAERQPILSASNFPPLPANADKPDAHAPIKRSYHHEDIMEIVKNMDENDCKLPEGKMDFDAHPAALTAEAHPDLLRNQRTYSIEQAREAMRQGRPIRSDSVGSIDYESMMYGEDYTKEAREQRKQTSTEGGGDKAAASKDAKPAAPKIFSFASAVINGTPAPPVEAKKPVAATPAPSSDKSKTAKAAPATGKDEKKPAAGKKPAAAAQETKKVVDETLPTAGAWGGRNFLDVVKSEPTVVPPPAAPVKAAAPAQEAPKRSDAKVWERNAGASSK